MSLYEEIKKKMRDGQARCARQVSFDMNESTFAVKKAMDELVGEGYLAHVRMIGNKNGYILNEHGGYGGAA